MFFKNDFMQSYMRTGGLTMQWVRKLSDIISQQVIAAIIKPDLIKVFKMFTFKEHLADSKHIVDI